MSAVAPVASRAPVAAATHRIASSSVGRVPFTYERSLRPRTARVSPAQHTTCSGSDR